MINFIIISLTQAVTELLPISSSGHLLIVTTILGTPANQTSLIFLHFWTALAIIVAYFSKIINLLKTKEGLKTLLYVGLATIPAAIAGFLLDEWFETNFYSLAIIAFNFIFWGIAMIFVEKRFDKPAIGKNEDVEIDDEKNLTGKITIKQAIFMGLSQIIALIPGTSRSGITTMTGMVSGLKKPIALDFAFLLGIPVTIGPFIIKILKDRSLLSTFFTTEYLVEGVATFVFALLAISILQSLKRKKFLTGFGIYRIIAGLALLVYIIVKGS